MSRSIPGNIGKRLLPSLVDEIAASDPDRIFYSVAKTTGPADGFQDINARTFARAVNRCSWHIEKHLGRGHGFPTLAYIGPQDVVYAILVLACVKTGFKLLLLSPRISAEASLSLLEKTECKTFLRPPDFPFPSLGHLNVVEIPALQHWLEDGPEELYPYTKTFEEAKSEPFVIFHTSGSTGMPKPVIHTHGTIAPLDSFTALPSLGFPATYPAMCAGSRVYLAFPLCHCAGLSMLLPGSIYSGFTVVLGSFPPTAEVVDAVHVHRNVQQSCIAPMILMDLVKEPKYLENLGRLDQVTYGGGPLPKAVGDAISSRTRLLNCLGSTECGILPSQLCDRDDWAHMSFSPVLGQEYRQVSEGLYEHVIVRESKLSQYQGIFATFPDLDEWPMKDLYSKHPTKENCWLYQGRADDIIVFSTGEKLNPVEMERTIAGHPAARDALVIGTGRLRPGLLVEVVTTPANETEREELVEKIWPFVEKANQESPSQRRIDRAMIMFTSADKPMMRADKGTVQRKLTVDAYASEIDALYKGNEGQLSNPNSDWDDGRKWRYSES
ncbi:hypothetical protein ACJ41O_008450 [Fusarium nematophilum]